MDKRVYIYKITNSINNKVYIGQTIQPEIRWSNHKSDAKRKPIQYVHHAMAKYGVDNFSFEVIASCITNNQKDIDVLEDEIIIQYNSRTKQFGYNVKPGGATRSNGWKQSEETKKKMSEDWHKYHSTESIQKTTEANRGKPCTEERKQKIAKANKGKQFCLGHKQSEETIKKRMSSIMARYGDTKCNVSDCNRMDGFKVNGIRYCNMHQQRLVNTGSLELMPRIAPNKGKLMSESTKEKCRQANLGKIPHNKTQFTDEQITYIMLDTRPSTIVAKELNVHKSVIQRLRKKMSKVC